MHLPNENILLKRKIIKGVSTTDICIGQCIYRGMKHGWYIVSTLLLVLFIHRGMEHVGISQGQEANIQKVIMVGSRGEARGRTLASETVFAFQLLYIGKSPLVDGLSDHKILTVQRSYKMHYVNLPTYTPRSWGKVTQGKGQVLRPFLKTQAATLDLGRETHPLPTRQNRAIGFSKGNSTALGPVFVRYLSADVLEVRAHFLKGPESTIQTMEHEPLAPITRTRPLSCEV